MDDMMKFFYNALYNLDVDKCTEITQPFSELEIQVNSQKFDFTEFLIENSTPISGEFCTTQNKAMQASKEGLKDKLYSPAEAEFFKTKYVEYNKVWSLIRPLTTPSELKRKSLGFSEIVRVYNGFPLSTSSEEFAANPAQIYEILKKACINNSIEKDALSKPEIYKTTKVFLLPEFQKDYLIRKDSKQK